MRKTQVVSRRAASPLESRLFSWLVTLFSIGIATFLALTLVAMAHGQTLSQQANASRFIMHYQQLDATQFPRIVSYVTVADSAGTTVGGLTKDHFNAQEDGVRELPLWVEEITDRSEAVTVALAIDRSGSMEEKMPDAQNAATAFVNLMGANDRAALVSFASEVRVDQNFTAERPQLISAIQALEAKGGTAIYDAALVCADLLQPLGGRKAIILLTDGLDRDSKATFEQVSQRFSGLGIPIFAVGLGMEISAANLRALAESSGGRYYFSPTSKQLEEIYKAISDLLRHSYRITYTTHNPTTDGSQRQVRLEANYQNAAASANNTYRAPDHVPTIMPVTQQVLAPEKEFQLRVEIPAESKYVYNLFDVQFVLTYDSRYLRLKTPANTNVVPLDFFGSPTQFVFAVDVDSTLGRIALRLQRKAGLAPVEGRGALVQINFHALANLPDDVNVDFNIVALSARDKNNWPLALQARNLTLQSAGLIVWPGDTNNNGTVELTDVTALGLHWAVTGPKRPGAENQNAWEPRAAKRFANLKATHADANGNGKIDERDLFPIALNWRKTTTSTNAPKSAAIAQDAPQGRVQIRLEPMNRAGYYRVRISFQSESADAFAGMAFRMRYPHRDVRVVSAEPTTQWGSAPLVFRNNDTTLGTLAMSLMLPSETSSITSSGELVEIILQSEVELRGGDLSLFELAVVSPSGDLREVSGAPETENAIAPSAFTLHPTYPNPARMGGGEISAYGTMLRFELPEAAEVNATVFDLSGRRVRELQRDFFPAGAHTLRWDGRGANGTALSTGVYVIKLSARTANAQPYSATQKVALMR